MTLLTGTCMCRGSKHGLNISVYEFYLFRLVYLIHSYKTTQIKRLNKPCIDTCLDS